MIDTAGGSTSADVGEGAIPPSPAPNVVHLACPCPGHPHAFDVVTLDEHASNRMGVAAAASGERHAGDAVAIPAELGSIFLRYGIKSWTFRDANGPVTFERPIPEDLIDRWLPFRRGGLACLNAASDIYTEDIFGEFPQPPATRSPAMLAGHMTSAKTGSGRSRPRPSRRSSLTSSAGMR